ncbi:putative short-chain dehydrogenase [Aaosphaeria arxii CBS 175.79]|uniref:Putative short-chain dehydrogenase n=1 Tax=Aaosphaeria arxii CBS 175.79 TaxID=1450172 RepID=A0A6A5Y802_9PLEO|nr:putative short-chain dehydrogenase [Aaosphaeria arxii CBS 175.79]KAF2021439.1 putative short-chain dehydrogenase [Aaosphaeria arxii CBS 175.79]
MAAAAKKLVLITGANSGIGFELAAQLMSKGTYHVFLGARSPEKGNAALKDLQSRNLPGSAEFIHIDATDDKTISNAASSVKDSHGKLDILVNNAAVAVVPGSSRQQLNTSFDTNATGPWVIGETFLPLLKNSTSPSRRVINISSGAGSINRRLDSSSPIYKMQEVQYRASKAALNMVTACQFVEFGEFGIKVFAYDPGFTVSNLGPYNTKEKGARSAEESVRPLVDVLEGKRDDEAGRFLHNTGDYPW